MRLERADALRMWRPFRGRELDGVEIFSAADLNGDGQLDMVGIASGGPVRLLGKGSKGYHWQVMRPRAQPTAGDQRINSFGVGGEIEIRSGLLTQKQILTGQPVHFGLGTRTGIDVARIVWPNGIMQADFDRKADESVVAEQRLKGSCPWVFTYDGTGMQFVTDFLWRSPLGLRINAVDTAGVTQTEDWVKIRGDQLAARNGAYDIRITAELWETHFIDHVSLLVVDHPADQDVFVDERFAREAPALAVHTTTHPRPVAQAWDESGRDVTELVAKQDGRYLATFARGDYQGIAKDHFVEIDLGEDGSRCRRAALAGPPLARRVRLDLSDRQQHQRRDWTGHQNPAPRIVARGAGRIRTMDRRVAGSGISRGEEQDDSRGSRADRARRHRASASGAPAHEPGDLLGLARAGR